VKTLFKGGKLRQEIMIARMVFSSVYTSWIVMRNVTQAEKSSKFTPL